MNKFFSINFLSVNETGKVGHKMLGLKRFIFFPERRVHSGWREIKAILEIWNKFMKVREFHFNSMKSHGIFLFVSVYNKKNGVRGINFTSWYHSFSLHHIYWYPSHHSWLMINSSKFISSQMLYPVLRSNLVQDATLM